MASTTPEVPVGLATKVGYSTGLSAFILAIVAYLSGDRSADTVAALVTGASGLAVIGITGLGRQLQAIAKEKGVDIDAVRGEIGKYVQVQVDPQAIQVAAEAKATDILDGDDSIHEANDGDPSEAVAPNDPSTTDTRTPVLKTLEG